MRNRASFPPKLRVIKGSELEESGSNCTGLASMPASMRKPAIQAPLAVSLLRQGPHANVHNHPHDVRKSTSVQYSASQITSKSNSEGRLSILEQETRETPSANSQVRAKHRHKTPVERVWLGMSHKFCTPVDKKGQSSCNKSRIRRLCGWYSCLLDQNT
jgi:NAD-dependent oxidoreductase involved in siderophore biosynthesis